MSSPRCRSLKPECCSEGTKGKGECLWPGLSSSGWSGRCQGRGTGRWWEALNRDRMVSRSSLGSRFSLMMGMRASLVLSVRGPRSLRIAFNAEDVSNL